MRFCLPCMDMAVTSFNHIEPFEQTDNTYTPEDPM